MASSALPLDASLPGEAAALREVRDVLRSDRTSVALADAAFERIPFGLSNFAWRATTVAGTRFFVRLAAPQAERLGADHRTECRLLALAADAGIAPPVVRCDASARVLVTRWIDAGTPPAAAEQRRVVAAVLARLHGLPPPAAVRHVDFERQAQWLERSAPQAPGSTLRQVAASVFERLHETQRALVLCHHDLHPLNLVWDRSSRPWVVDWEYAGLGDAALDLASFASQHGLRARARATLLSHYLAAGGVADACRLELATWAFDYVQWLWYLARRDTEGGGAGEVMTARARRLHASLRARASGVLRCDNGRFEARACTREVG